MLRLHSFGTHQKPVANQVAQWPAHGSGIRTEDRGVRVS